MTTGRHMRGTADRLAAAAPVTASGYGTSRTSSRRQRHGRSKAGRLRRFPAAVPVFVLAFLLASGTATLAYETTSGNGTGQAQAVTLSAPGSGTASNPSATSLLLSWGASSGLPANGGYLVLRSTSSGGPYAKVSSGGCSQATTLVSSATTCTDTGLATGKTYYYEVEASFYDIDTLWTSATDAQFSGTTGPTAASPGTGVPPPAGGGPTTGNPGTGGGVAPTITSANSTLFLVGTADTFQVTATGSPASMFSNVAFTGCTPSALPQGVALSGTGLLSGTPSANAVGTYTLCINADNGLSPHGTQSLTLTIGTGVLVISSPTVSGATSNTPNLGPITVRRQTSSGIPITTDNAVTVNLTSTTSTGASFGTTQFATTPATNVTIPSGQSTATFWYGSTTPGSATITASATGYTSGTEPVTITAAPAGLGILPGAGSTGSPVIKCGTPAPTFGCTVTGVGNAGHLAFSVVFWNATQQPVVYSGTQASKISESGQGTGAVTIQAGASGSSPETLTAPLGTSTLNFGPYSVTVNVSA